MVSKKINLKKILKQGIIILALITYFMISFNGYHTFNYSLEQKNETIMNEQKITINQKIRGLEKYNYILDSKIKEIELSSGTYPIFLVQMQKYLKEISILNIEHGISVNVIDNEKKKVITASAAMSMEYFLEEFFKEDLSREFFNGVEFLVNDKEIGIVKKIKSLERYSIFLRISRNLFFKNEKKENPFFMKFQGNWIGLPEENIESYKGEFIKLKYKELGDITFAIANKDNFYERLWMLFFWLLVPILPIFFIYSQIYKAALKIFYNPLEKIAKGLSSDEIKDVNIIDYLEGMYEEISERNKFLSEQIQKNQESLKEVLLRKVALGIGNSQIIKQYYSDEGKVYRFGVINIVTFNKNIEENLYIFSKLALSLEKYFDFEVFPINNETLFFISKTNFEIEKLKEILLEATEEEVNLFSFVSEKTYSISDLENKYKEFSKNLAYKGKLISKIVITEKDVENLSCSYSYYYPVDIEQKVFLRINNLNIQGTTSIFEELFEENFVKRNIQGESVSRFKKAIVNSMDRIIMQFELNELIEKTYKDFFEKRDELENDEFKKITYDILEEIIKTVKILKGSDGTNVEYKMKKFIEENYNREVSLNEFAEYMGVTPQYASNLFKRVNGENFNVSINKYRIEKAIEIFKFKNGQIKVKELAELVGYSSSITFINNFKKIHKISPTKYFELTEV